MQFPLVSIIVPVYNCEKYLERCLNALVKQTYQNLEILCINDGSTDNSYEILKHFALSDKRVILLSQKNSGPAKARTVGLAHASGKYLMFCDSDDWYEPDMCEKMVCKIEEEDTDLVVCTSKTKVDYDCPIERIHLIPYCSTLPLAGKCKLDDESKRKINTMLWNKIYKTKLIKDYGITFNDSMVGEDTVFNFQYFTVSKNIYALHESLYNYTVRDDSLLDKFYTKKAQNSYDQIRMFNLYYDFLKKHRIETENESLFFSLLIHFFRTSLKVSTSENEKNQAVEFLYSVLNKTKYNYKKYVILKYINKLNLEQLIKKLSIMRDEDFLYTQKDIWAKKISRILRLMPILLEV